MKKTISLLLALLMLCALSACGEKTGGEKTDEATWTREGYFSDENDNMLSISPSEEEDHPGWYVGCMLGDGIYGWYIDLKGNNLYGDLAAGDEGADPFVVTLSEEGEDGVLLSVENGESYHFVPMEVQEASISVLVNIEGMGQIAYAAEGDEVAFDEEFPSQSAMINLAEPAQYTIAAKPDEGWKFLKWTWNGADYATEPEIDVELNESGEFIAVFGVAGTNEAHVDLDSVTTLGELLGLPNYGYSTTEELYIYAFEQDGIYYRAIAKLTAEQASAIFALDFDDADYNEKLNGLVSELKVDRIENISAAIPAQEELDALVGKTGGDLLDDGWSIYGWNLEDMEFYMNHSLFSFVVTLEGEVGDIEEFSDENIRPMVVKSVTYEGLGDLTDPEVVLP